MRYPRDFTIGGCEALIHYMEVNVIFGTSLIEGTTGKERAIYVNVTRRMVLIGLLSTPSRPITFSATDAYTILFPHNDALVVTLHIGNCRVFKILVDTRSSVNIFYGGVVDKIEDTPEMARAMINPQTRSHMYVFDGYETHSPDTVSLPVQMDLYNVIMEFYVIDVEFPHNAILERPWIHAMKVVPLSYHQPLQYSTPTETADIQGYRAMSRTVNAIARKKSGRVPKAAIDDDSAAEKKQKWMADQ